MLRRLSIAVLFILSLGLFLGCETSLREAAVIQWTSTFDRWKKTADNSEITHAELAAFESWGIDFEEVGVFSRELTFFRHQANLKKARFVWDSIVSRRETVLTDLSWEKFLGTEITNHLDWMKEKNITSDDIDRSHRELSYSMTMFHARQAEYAMKALYRFSPSAVNWNKPWTPRQLHDRVQFELRLAKGFSADPLIFEHGEVCLEHASHLKTLAYQRIQVGLLSELRSHRWTFPTSSDKVDLFFEICYESTRNPSDFGTTYKELEMLRLRVPEIITVKPHDG